LLISPCVQGVITVPIDYETIQNAIDNATPGEEILVESGTYNENLIIYTPVILHGIDIGGGIPTIQTNGGHEGISIRSDNVVLQYFNVINGVNGIRTENAENISIFCCFGSGNDNGISIVGSSNVTVRDCVLTGNSNGIYLVDGSTQNSIINNTASSNSRGIALAAVSNNTVTNNLVFENTADGIYLTDGSVYNSVINNSVSANNRGIALAAVSNNNISENNVTTNIADGIYAHANSQYNTISTIELRVTIVEFASTMPITT